MEVLLLLNKNGCKETARKLSFDVCPQCHSYPFQPLFSTQSIEDTSILSGNYKQTERLQSPQTGPSNTTLTLQYHKSVYKSLSP